MTFKITFAPSGHTIAVEASDTILAAAIKQGRGLPYSCKTGICRTCRGKVESGTVDLGEAELEYLSAEEREQGFALLCQARPLSDCVINVKELYQDSMPPKVVQTRVISIEKPAHDVAVVRLKLPMNEKMRFAPGQYIDLLLEHDKRRSYSIASVPEVEGVTQIELHIRHLPGGLFTDHLFTQMKGRELMRFEGPFGSSSLRVDSLKPIIMVASGTGFAPIKSMVEFALRRGFDSERPITLYWGCRTRADLYMVELPAKWAVENNGFTFIPVLSAPTADCAWEGRTGFVHQAIVEDFPDLSGHEVYACGAPVMVESARRDFVEKCHLPDDMFIADSFVTEADRAAA